MRGTTTVSTTVTVQQPWQHYRGHSNLVIMCTELTNGRLHDGPTRWHSKWLPVRQTLNHWYRNNVGDSKLKHHMTTCLFCNITFTSASVVRYTMLNRTTRTSAMVQQQNRYHASGKYLTAPMHAGNGAPSDQNEAALGEAGHAVSRHGRRCTTRTTYTTRTTRQYPKTYLKPVCGGSPIE